MKSLLAIVFAGLISLSVSACGTAVKPQYAPPSDYSAPPDSKE